MTLRDRFTKFLAAGPVHDKTTKGVTDFLVNLRAPMESIAYVYSDGAGELKKACAELNIAHDSTQPANKKQNSVAERANAIVQDGARSLLMSAGLPPQYWVYAVPYFCLCLNAQAGEDGESPWKTRFGEPFTSPLIPFGLAVRYLPPPDSRLKQPKTGPRTRVGIYMGYVHHAGGRAGPDRY